MILNAKGELVIASAQDMPECLRQMAAVGVVAFIFSADGDADHLCVKHPGQFHMAHQIVVGRAIHAQFNAHPLVLQVFRQPLQLVRRIIQIFQVLAQLDPEKPHGGRIVRNSERVQRSLGTEPCIADLIAIGKASNAE